MHKIILIIFSTISVFSLAEHPVISSSVDSPIDENQIIDIAKKHSPSIRKIRENTLIAEYKKTATDNNEELSLFKATLSVEQPLWKNSINLSEHPLWKRPINQDVDDPRAHLEIEIKEHLRKNEELLCFNYPYNLEEPSKKQKNSLNN